MVEEAIPLAAGDVIPRVGLLLEISESSTETGQPIGKFAWVLFGNRKECLPYNNIRKVDNYGG